MRYFITYKIGEFGCHLSNTEVNINGTLETLEQIRQIEKMIADQVHAGKVCIIEWKEWPISVSDFDKVKE